MRPTKTQAIKSFLSLNTHQDLANSYSFDMEVQVNVARGSGTRIEGEYKGKNWSAWTDGIQTWKPFRIPYNANSNPSFSDHEMSYDLAVHVEGIGMTGWDWNNKLSRWVAFDFDAITGHSEKHKRTLSEDDLQKLIQTVKDVDWVTLRKSTSGKGLHLYVYLEPVETMNHHEHAALARAILGKLSQLVNYDFFSKVDTCGGNMWIWHRKMKGTDGLTLLKQGGLLDQAPLNWKDHIKVITGKRQKNLPKFIETQSAENTEIVDVFDELTSQRVRINLDEDHKKLILWLETNYPNSTWWDTEHHMLVAHTFILKEAHSELALRGPFETNAQGSEKGYDHNCFCYPLRKGAWAVRRYTPGASEHPLWEQNGTDWTRTFLNRDPDLNMVARLYEGQEDPAGGFLFSTAENAQKAAILLGTDLEIPSWALGRKAKLKRHRDGRLIVEVDRDNQDGPIKGYLASKSKHSRLLDMRNAAPPEPEAQTIDDEVRHLVSESNEDLGWVIKGDNRWNDEPLVHVKAYLASRGYGPKDVTNIIGSSIQRCWTIVNRPFQPEYLPDRQWNRNAAQLRYTPTIERDNLNYPHWNLILNHCGQGLDHAIKSHEWCKANNIMKGADYLKCWIASVFQKPLEPLPYLFFYGDQNSGKSIFHEALSLLVIRGYVRADVALVSQAGFNGELENSVIDVVEETDLKKNQAAYNRIKDWVTSRQIAIHRKMRQPYLIPNTTHWIHCANSHMACPIFQGDTRITLINVGKLQNLIPKKDLIASLEREAADFLAEVLYLEIPESQDRLNLPIIITEDKELVESNNRSYLQFFLEEKCFEVPGSMIKLSEFVEQFHAWLEPNQVQDWGKIRVGKELPPKYPKGRRRQDAQFYIGNISFERPKEDTKPVSRLYLKDGYLVT